MVADVSNPNLDRQEQRCESHPLISNAWQAGRVGFVCYFKEATACDISAEQGWHDKEVTWKAGTRGFRRTS